jgi:cation diffusion facilitator family transporter
VAISSVVLVEISLGLLAGSLAIVSDGLHAMLDALTTFALYFATRASLKPPDEEHMYGHEKFESIGGFLGGIVLIGVALLILYEAIMRIIANQSVNLGFEYAGIIAVGYTFVIDFFRVSTFIKASKSESSTMKAGFYHAIADLSSTLIAFLGFGLAIVGIAYGDALASIVLSGLLFYFSIKLAWGCGMELSDTIPKDVAEEIRKQILDVKGASCCKDLRVRKAGTKTFVEASVQVPEYISLEEAHALASEIEEKLKASLGNTEATIHVEPAQTEIRTEKLLEKLATEIGGVKEAHEISTVFTKGKLYVTLHVGVDPKLSVNKAHEIAEKVEGNIKRKLNYVENITVHVEPFEPAARRTAMLDEREIKRIAYETAENLGQTLRIRRILTYFADKKRYINIDCTFTGHVTIEDAHEVVSQIEENIRKYVENAIVTVHIEPEKSEVKE